jgi:hypothetical protein
VDLTGGNDTRLTAAVLASPGGAELGKAVTFKVHAASEHPDARIARKIADEFGWSLRRFDRAPSIADESTDSLRKVAVLSDGSRLLSDLARGLTHQASNWGDHPNLLGSLGGEFLRDFFWRHELLNMGRTPRVDYDAFLAQRLYASADVDFARVSGGALCREDHDEHLVNGYGWIEAGAPSLLNVYKLDRIGLHKYMFHADHWRFSELRTTKLPYLASEFLDLVLRLPWRHRTGRKIQTAVVERIHPKLSSIPHNSGVPMQPLRLRSLGAYARSSVSETFGAWNRHFGPGRRKATNVRSAAAFPEAWRKRFTDNTEVLDIGGFPSVLRRVGDRQTELTSAEARECEMLLLLGTLGETYPKLKLHLSFDHCNPLLPGTSTNL